MKNNPFGDEPIAGKKAVNPFGEESDETAAQLAANRLEHASRRIRHLRSQMGAEGLTAAGTREMIDEIASAMEAAARAFRAER